MHPTIRIPEMRGRADTLVPSAGPEELVAFMRAHRGLLVLTGAGCSTRSGIPCYRDADGQWLQRRPILYQEFVSEARVRRRYWARSYLGWPVVARAGANRAHRALVALESAGVVGVVITQNVDGLHRRAGQRSLVELHGQLDRVRCLDCGRSDCRERLQARLAELNRHWSVGITSINADGDAELDARAWPGFRVAGCDACGGRLKPEAVFFGESIPSAVRETVQQRLDAAGAVLVVGSSLVVGSAYRLVREAARRGLPVAAVNAGRTRADALIDFKVPGDCEAVLAQAAVAMGVDVPACSRSK